jgi:SAM-dependent methyltransferase
MDDYTDATYGDRIAGIYDERYMQTFSEDTAGAVRFLTELAGAGPALELGIGTGRVAIPLAEAGVEVHGIDASEAMLSRLKDKPGGDAIPTTVGSFAGFSLPGRFRLVYVVFNTFFGLRTQEEQVSCFESVARHLTPDGAFAMQAFVPDVTRFDAHNQRVSADLVETDEISLEVSEHDPFAQRTKTTHVVVRDGTVRLYPVRIRYAHVSELDLMARLAGLRLRERWSGWDREPYPSRSWTHVSVWEPGAVGPS